MITEDYVSFETAELLNKKEFDGEFHIHYFFNEKDNKVEMLPKPTLQMAMKWLREVHNLFIGLDYVNIAGLGCVYQASIIKLTDYYNYCIQKHSYEEACEAAIKYCLEKLV